MVSVQAMLIDAMSPRMESVPYSLYVSSNRPVAADEENIFTMVRGTSSPGNPTYLEKLPIISARKSRKPEARRTPTATISPTRVGMIFMTVKNPFLAPLIKVSYTSTFIMQP